MTTSRTYSTAAAFRKALEERLRTEALTQPTDLKRLRRKVAFDRLLARLFRPPGVPWRLKGGYALELRFRAARSTIDIDVTVGGAPSTEGLRMQLQDAANAAVGDWFEYTVGRAVVDLTAAPYGGARFPIVARVDDRVFARFHLDAGIGDAIIHSVEAIDGPDWLAFAGIPAPRICMISREQQFAEKVHAYTLPRETPNSRLKDLTDLGLLIQSGMLDGARVREALTLTFGRRRTHDLPATLPLPPADWQS